MGKYSKEFKEEALKLSDEIGVKNAANQLGIAYYTLADWRSMLCTSWATTICVGQKHRRSIFGIRYYTRRLDRNGILQGIS